MSADNNRLFQHVERFFAKHEKTQWPTVRQIAKSFGWTQARVLEAVEDDPDARLCTTSYFTVPEPPMGEHFVESYGDG